LASGPAARITYCESCEALSLHVGPLTMRLDPAAAEALWATLDEALSTLQTERLGHAPSRAVLRRGRARGCA
jgi:hypothetical protein